MGISNGKILYGSLHHLEPLNKNQNGSFTYIKDLTIENDNFVDTYLININNQKIILKNEIIDFKYQTTMFNTFNMEV